MSKNKQNKKIIFIGSALDFHAIDWYRSIKSICKTHDVCFITDIIHSEGHSQIVKKSDKIIELYNIDWLLFKSQSTFGNIWRNFIKILFFFAQAQRLKQITYNHPDAIYHAHTMYYLLLSWKAGIRYIGSPQGDEILIRPYRSKIYKYFAKRALIEADHLVIDSVNLQNGIKKLSNKASFVLQYGIDVEAINSKKNITMNRSKVVSLRALYPLYRVHEIINARDQMNYKQPLTIFYPFWEDNYKEKISNMLQPFDINMGRIPIKSEMYSILASTLLVISIPESDSSPRSVYESIFSGCCVATTFNPWINSLPDCMRQRIHIVDIDDKNWLIKSIEYARTVVKKSYNPSERALDMFDQTRSMKKVAQKFYQ